jgi:multidrug efflux pump subunit AcrA (membrane-fusion protein)
MVDSHRWQTLLDDVARSVNRHTTLADFAREIAELIAQQGAVSWVGLWFQDLRHAAEVLIAGSPAAAVKLANVPDEPTRQQARTAAYAQQRPLWLSERTNEQNLNTEGVAPTALLVPVPALGDGVYLWEFLGIVPRPEPERAALKSILEAVANLTAEHLREAEIARLKHQHQKLRKWLEICAAAIRTTDGQQALNLLADETRALADCDRAWILEIWNDSSAAVAVSAASRVERRSALARGIEQLVDSVVVAHRQGGPSVAGVDLLSLADPQLRHNVFNLTGSRDLALLPLPSDSSDPQAIWAGCLICESFQRPLSPPSADWELWRQCGGSLVQGLRRTHHPFWKRLWNLEGPAWRRFVTERRALWWGGIALLLLCPWPYRVAADGELRPLDELRLFAPEDAVVTEVLVGHGESVVAGQSLLQLRSSRLDLEQERVLGELRAARERLAGVESTRLGGGKSSTNPLSGSPTGLSGEEAGLREQVASLERQAQSVAEQAAGLQIRAPGDGKVLTWDPAPRLRARPVQRGQILMELGSGRTGWRLDLWVPGRRARSLPAVRPSGTADVEFHRVAVPGVTGTARLSAVATAADVDPTGGPRVRVEALVEPTPATADFRPGEPVRARIPCGWRAAVFVLLPDFFDACRRWLPW